MSLSRRGVFFFFRGGGPSRRQVEGPVPSQSHGGEETADPHLTTAAPFSLLAPPPVRKDGAPAPNPPRGGFGQVAAPQALASRQTAEPLSQSSSRGPARHALALSREQKVSRPLARLSVL